VQSSASLSTLDGSCAASHMPVMPPRERPAKWGTVDARLVEQADQVACQIRDGVRAGRNLGVAVATRVVSAARGNRAVSAGNQSVPTSRQSLPIEFDNTSTGASSGPSMRCANLTKPSFPSGTPPARGRRTRRRRPDSRSGPARHPAPPLTNTRFTRSSAPTTSRNIRCFPRRHLGQLGDQFVRGQPAERRGSVGWSRSRRVAGHLSTPGCGASGRCQPTVHRRLQPAARPQPPTRSTSSRSGFPFGVPTATRPLVLGRHGRTTTWRPGRALRRIAASAV